MRRVILLLLVVGAASGSGCASRPAHLLPEDDLAGEAFALVDHRGERLDFPGDLAGRPAVVSAIYTHCPDVCLMTMAVQRNVRTALGADSSRAAFVTLTFDPARDTPEVLARYAETWRVGAGWRLATSPDTATVGSLMRRLGIRTRIASRDTLPDGTPTYHVDHSDKMLLLDAEGRIVETYGGSAAPPAMVADDVRALLTR